MIRAVHLRMTIQAITAQEKRRRRAVSKSVSRIGQARVTGLRMTALAHHGSAQGDHARVIGAVRIVATRTILGRRCMLPEIGTTFLGVAVVAGAVQGLAREQVTGIVTVGAVAATAIHLALAKRMRVRLHGLGPFLLVTVEAYLRLCRRNHDRIAGRVTGMAIGAGDFIVIVAAGMPGESFVTGVAIHAEFVLYRDRRSSIRAEVDRRRPFFAAPDSACMITAGPVTGLALQLAMAKRPVRVAGYRVFRAKDGQRDLVVMTGKAGIGAFTAVTRLCTVLSLGNGDTGRTKDHEKCGNRNSPWSDC